MLGIKYPIIAGGMAWVTEHTVFSEAGGLRPHRRRKHTGEVVQVKNASGESTDKEAVWR